ncbi:Translocation protein SEC62 [Kluyveromyces marxianus]
MTEPSPESALAIAKLLRTHKELKQRQGLFDSRLVDFFRYKRFVRALKSDQYKSKSNKQPNLYPPVNSDEDARNIFVSLIKSQLVVPAVKLHSHECKEHGLKPNASHPNLLLSDKATLQPDEYYVWSYNPKTIWDYVMVVGIILGVLAFVCYPLWPPYMKRATYYLSLLALGLIGAFFGIAILRFIIYLLSLAAVSEKGGFWLFPNLFEDCGVIDSFKPLYGFGETECYSFLKKQKRKKRSQSKKKK